MPNQSDDSKLFRPLSEFRELVLAAPPNCGCAIERARKAAGPEGEGPALLSTWMSDIFGVPAGFAYGVMDGWDEQAMDAVLEHHSNDEGYGQGRQLGSMLYDECLRGKL